MFSPYICKPMVLCVYLKAQLCDIIMNNISNRIKSADFSEKNRFKKMKWRNKTINTAAGKPDNQESWILSIQT